MKTAQLQRHISLNSHLLERTSEQIEEEIQAILGFVPPFFLAAKSNPYVLESLWQQTLTAYLNNPLPPLFKEKLSAYLSRFCTIPYCLICHSCSLYALNMQAHEVLNLLETPPSSEEDLEEHLNILAAYPGTVRDLSELNAELGNSVLQCAIFIALETERTEYYRAELSRVLGDFNYHYLVLFIAYVKTCHTWMEANPDIAYQDDRRVQTYFHSLTECNEDLANFFIHYWEQASRDRQVWAEQQAMLAERKRQEAKLQKMAEENRYLARAISSTSEGILITDPTQPENPIIYVNPAFSRITGYSSNEILGQNCRFLQGVGTDPQTVDHIRQAIREQREITATLLNYRKDGQPFWNELRIAPVFSEEGELLYFVGSQTDISERKRAEESLRQSESTLRSFFNSAPLMMGIVELREDDILHISDNIKTAELFGSSPELMQNRFASELDISSEYIRQWLEYYHEAARTQCPVRFEYQHRIGQDILWLSATVAAIATEPHQPPRFAYIVDDITEKKMLETQFLRAQRMESIGTLAGGIAHDLNNILTPILSSAQLLLMKTNAEDKKRRQLLETIQNSARRGASLIKQVLSFARGVEGKRTIFQMQHLISEIRQIVQETFPKSIQLNLNLTKDLWLVSGDATQLHQVLMNLCVNAQDAMPNGGILSLSATNLVINEQYARINMDAQPGSYIVISVTDTGSGIEPVVLNRIFEPFFTTKELGKGTGLGLSTVLAIVKSHGGFIEVNSVLGKGTEFRVYLPAVKSSEVLQPAEEELSMGHGELILVVDDEAAIRESNQVLLEIYNYRVLLAADGIEAIALYAEHKHEIRLALVDLMMPSLDGAAAIRALKKMNPQVKIIAISGLVSSAQLSASAGLDIDAFLPKPYSAKELIKCIAEVLQSQYFA